MPVLDRKTQAVLLTARGLTADHTGQAVGVCGATVRRWRRHPDFRADVERVRARILSEATDALAAAVRDSVTVLRHDLADETPAVRQDAARTLLGTLSGQHDRQGVTA